MMLPAGLDVPTCIVYATHDEPMSLETEKDRMSHSDKIEIKNMISVFCYMY